MKISVTQEHIDKGVRGSCSSDPIALAMREAGLERPYAGVTYMAWRKDNGDYSVLTPKVVLDFMNIYDNAPSMAQPFEFELSD